MSKEVWVKGFLVEHGSSDVNLKDAIMLLDKNNNPLYYTTVDADQVQIKEDDGEQDTSKI
jgi:hypothetical protein